MKGPGLTIRQLADVLGLEVDYVRRLCDRDIIRTRNFGKNTKRFIEADELARLRRLGFTVRAVQSVREVQDSQPTPEGTTVEP